MLGDALGVEVPAFEQAQLESAEWTDLVPTQYRADAVVVLTAGGKAGTGGGGGGTAES